MYCPDDLSLYFWEKTQRFLFNYFFLILSKDIVLYRLYLTLSLDILNFGFLIYGQIEKCELEGTG